MFFTVNASETNDLSYVTKNKTEYLIVRCNITKKTGRTYYHFEIDLGTENHHSLSGKLEVGEDGVLIASENGKQVTLLTETDMLNYISELGWVMISITPVSILDRDYRQYLFSKAE